MSARACPCSGGCKADTALKENTSNSFSFAPERLAPILHNLPGGTRTLPGSAFHKALELDRAMFAREVDRPLARALVASEVSALPNTPACVTAKKIGVACGVAQRGLASVVCADTREDTLQLLQAVLSIA